ncbi:LpxI family protein [Aquicoccus sp. G2-2]|uniref:LpxI family protein n=1 Tax=Aquicoccus sp. G2-2 TaxID=3092120 RepID=UPI002ADF289B|nr:UDP-2,3-diacylglucosamine diphosphatase LpxI [Aquicoccus sp. G2-2]MEA1113045.1 UDP-2,3-diacylglucosamine diphosphatase LpxI [Aquicoccus sp. G2-2]
MLALIAGSGKMPQIVARAQVVPPLICALKGNLPDGVEPDIVFGLETVGTLLLDLGNRGVDEVCFCGAIARPQIDPAKIDAESAPLMPLFAEALGKGDDGALRVVVDIFERTGFAVRGVHELAPALLPPLGALTQREPRLAHLRDVDKGREILAEMGRADLGQACVIRKGVVLEREDETGTDAMLDRLALSIERPHEGDPAGWAFDASGELREGTRAWLEMLSSRNYEAPGAGAVLYKAPKPEQERRADLPTIGPATALRAAQAGLDGIVIASGGCLWLSVSG